MSWIDIVILIAAAWFTYKGFTKGFVVEIAGLIALILGVYAALHFSSYSETVIRENSKVEEKYLNVISFAITFLVVVIGVFLIGKGLERVVKMVQLNFINKAAGALFGLVKTVFIFSILIAIVNKLDEKKLLLTNEIRQESLLFEPVEKVAPVIFPLIKLERFMDEEKNKDLDFLKKDDDSEAHE